jgi:hypothetical protein
VHRAPTVQARSRFANWSWLATGERLRIATPINRAFLALLRAVSDAARSG